MISWSDFDSAFTASKTNNNESNLDLGYFNPLSSSSNKQEGGPKVVGKLISLVLLGNSKNFLKCNFLYKLYF
jgi:hypothetical protein